MDYSCCCFSSNQFSRVQDLEVCSTQVLYRVILNHPKKMQGNLNPTDVQYLKMPTKEQESMVCGIHNLSRSVKAHVVHGFEQKAQIRLKILVCTLAQFLRPSKYKQEHNAEMLLSPRKYKHQHHQGWLLVLDKLALQRAQILKN